MADGHLQGTDSASYESVQSVEKRPGLRCWDVLTFALCWMVYFCATAVFSVLAPFFPIEVNVKSLRVCWLGCLRAAVFICGGVNGFCTLCVCVCVCECVCVCACYV